MRTTALLAPLLLLVGCGEPEAVPYSEAPMVISELEVGEPGNPKLDCTEISPYSVDCRPVVTWDSNLEGTEISVNQSVVYGYYHVFITRRNGNTQTSTAYEGDEAVRVMRQWLDANYPEGERR